MHTIPKIVHISWNNKKVVDDPHPLIQNGLARLRDLNPGWRIEISDDQDIDAYLRRSLNARDYALISHKHIVEKSDLWRLFKIYNEGGMYVDIDRFCNRCLDDIIDDDVKWVLPTCLDYDFSQDIMISVPQNPVFYEAIMLVLARRRTGTHTVYMLGPQTYMHAVTKVLLGQSVDSHPPAEVFQHIRQQIGTMSFIKTYREHPPYDTIIYQQEEQGDIADWESMKRSFYSKNGLRHWSGQW